MRFKKGSAAAKAFMAKIRSKKGKPKAAAKKKIGAVKKKVSVRKKVAPKKKAVTKKHTNWQVIPKHERRVNGVSIAGSIGSVMTHFKDQYGKLASKKLMEKTKREKNKLAKQMTVIAAKLKKLKNFLA